MALIETGTERSGEIKTRKGGGWGLMEDESKVPEFRFRLRFKLRLCVS